MNFETWLHRIQPHRLDQIWVLAFWQCWHWQSLAQAIRLLWDQSLGCQGPFAQCLGCPATQSSSTVEMMRHVHGYDTAGHHHRARPSCCDSSQLVDGINPSRGWWPALDPPRHTHFWQCLLEMLVTQQPRLVSLMPWWLQSSPHSRSMDARPVPSRLLQPGTRWPLPIGAKAAWPWRSGHHPRELEGERKWSDWNHPFWLELHLTKKWSVLHSEPHPKEPGTWNVTCHVSVHSLRSSIGIPMAERGATSPWPTRPKRFAAGRRSGPGRPWTKASGAHTLWGPWPGLWGRHLKMTGKHGEVFFRTKTIINVKKQINKYITHIYTYTYTFIFIYLFINTCVCMHARMHVRMWVCAYVCMSVCLSLCLYVCMSVCVYDACMHVCMSVCLYVCMSVCVYVCMCVCMCM